MGSKKAEVVFVIWIFNFTVFGVFRNEDGAYIVNGCDFLEGRYVKESDENGKPTYFWEPDSLGYLLAEVVGNFYRCNTLKEVASFTRIQIHRVRQNA